MRQAMITAGRGTACRAMPVMTGAGGGDSGLTTAAFSSLGRGVGLLTGEAFFDTGALAKRFRGSRQKVYRVAGDDTGFGSTTTTGWGQLCLFVHTLASAGNSTGSLVGVLDVRELVSDSGGSSGTAAGVSGR